MSPDPRRIKELESRLDSFDAAIRSESLEELVELADSGLVDFKPTQSILNLHCHTFYSYNAYGYSPSKLAWLGKKSGLRFMGVVDFDVLDGVDEFFRACDLLNLRATAGMETRIFVPEFAQDVISSPGEPGVCYHMGVGFSSRTLSSEVLEMASYLRQRADKRNRQLIERLNFHIKPLKLDYDLDVLPMTPSGYATERHMVIAVQNKAKERLHNPAPFWSEKLQLPLTEIEQLFNNEQAFLNLLRKKLFKHCGLAYQQPTAATFPLVEPFHELVIASGALPCYVWLDGTSSGEQRMAQLLTLFTGKGVAALNIIPDRNWNFQDPQEKQLKLKNLQELVALAERFNLPLNIGTEMNSYGQKFVDTFEAPELEPFHEAFIAGAEFIYGHTLLERTLGLGYQSQWAQKQLKMHAAKVDFYQGVGHIAKAGTKYLKSVSSLSDLQSPEQVLIALNRIS